MIQADKRERKKQKENMMKYPITMSNKNFSIPANLKDVKDKENVKKVIKKTGIKWVKKEIKIRLISEINALVKRVIGRTKSKVISPFMTFFPNVSMIEFP
jgi:mRNA-degrading endonuclease HigB of HigAB toxin-antitoxin module